MNCIHWFIEKQKIYEKNFTQNERLIMAMFVKERNPSELMIILIVVLQNKITFISATFLSQLPFTDYFYFKYS